MKGKGGKENKFREGGYLSVAALALLIHCRKTFYQYKFGFLFGRFSQERITSLGKGATYLLQLLLFYCIAKNITHKICWGTFQPLYITI